jgi:hypothetical protein
MMHACLLGLVIAFAGCAAEPSLSTSGAEVATETETSTSTSTDINWMGVGSCDPNRSSSCSVVCAGDYGYAVLAGTCDAGSCRVPDLDGACAVTECYAPSSTESCDDPYRSIRDASGLRFCCKPYGK